MAETPHTAFVAEYIDELAAFEHLGDATDADSAKSSPGNFAASVVALIQDSTRYELELKSRMRVLQSMRLNPPFDQLIPRISDLYGQRARVLHSYVDAISGALDTVAEYGKLSAQIARVKPELEYIDRDLLTECVEVSRTVQDQRRDTKNMASHLVITRAERDMLLRHIADGFGSNLDQEKSVSMNGVAAMIIERMLTGFKCSDEPWE